MDGRPTSGIIAGEVFSRGIHFATGVEKAGLSEP
jgi:hypothetical protein